MLKMSVFPGLGFSNLAFRYVIKMLELEDLSFLWEKESFFQFPSNIGLLLDKY